MWITPLHLLKLAGIIMLISGIFSVPAFAQNQLEGAISIKKSTADQEDSQNSEGFKIRFPARCEYGVDCWLMNTPDLDPAQEDVKDSTCSLSLSGAITLPLMFVKYDC